MEKQVSKMTPSPAQQYDYIAREIFRPVFPLIAQTALSAYGHKEGTCLDVGCGGGMFGYAVADASNLSVTFFDISNQAIEICKNRGKERGIFDRCQYVVGDVHYIPLPDDSFDLIISRSSLGFWGGPEELKQAYRELYRILKPGGTTLIGSSLGTPEIEAEIIEKMRIHDPLWPNRNKSKKNGITYEGHSQILAEIGIQHKIIEKIGTWICMEKDK